MPTGSCFCGEVGYEYTGDVQAKALCHCRDCQKISGSTYSTNIIVPGEGFKIIKGTPKLYKTKADSGNDITSSFCGTCGSTLFREGPTFGTAKVIKVGGLDDPKALEDAKPVVELYVPERTSWVSAVAGTDQKKAMPNTESVAA